MKVVSPICACVTRPTTTGLTNIPRLGIDVEDAPGGTGAVIINVDLSGPMGDPRFGGRTIWWNGVTQTWYPAYAETSDVINNVNGTKITNAADLVSVLGATGSVPAKGAAAILGIATVSQGPTALFVGTRS